MNPRYVNAPDQFVKKTTVGYRRDMVLHPGEDKPRMTEINYGPTMFEISDGSNASNRLCLSRENACAVVEQLNNLLQIHVAIGILRRRRADTEDFEYLVGQISNTRKHAGLWEFPGGKQNDTDKNLEETLKREWREELGVEIEVFREVHYQPYPHDPKYVTLHFFTIHTDQEPQCKDHQQIAWKTMEELHGMDTMDAVMKTDFHTLIGLYPNTKVNGNGAHA